MESMHTADLNRIATRFDCPWGTRAGAHSSSIFAVMVVAIRAFRIRRPAVAFLPRSRHNFNQDTTHSLRISLCTIFFSSPIMVYVDRTQEFKLLCSQHPPAKRRKVSKHDGPTAEEVAAKAYVAEGNNIVSLRCAAVMCYYQRLNIRCSLSLSTSTPLILCSKVCGGHT